MKNWYVFFENEDGEFGIFIEAESFEDVVQKMKDEQDVPPSDIVEIFESIFKGPKFH